MNPINALRGCGEYHCMARTAKQITACRISFAQK